MCTPVPDCRQLAHEMRKAVFMLGHAVTNMENGQVGDEHRRTMAEQLTKLANELERGPGENVEATVVSEVSR